MSWRKADKDQIPDVVVKLAGKRTADMVTFYGRFIRSITLDQLAESCYLQGVEDAMSVAVKELVPKEPLDFQI